MAMTYYMISGWSYLIYSVCRMKKLFELEKHISGLSSYRCKVIVDRGVDEPIQGD